MPAEWYSGMLFAIAPPRMAQRHRVAPTMEGVLPDDRKHYVDRACPEPRDRNGVGIGMGTFTTIAVFTVGLVGLAYGINAQHSIQASARKEAEAWHEVRNLE